MPDSPSGGESVSSAHAYMLTFDETIFYSSGGSINPAHVPFIYGDGQTIKAALFLDGFGTISDIADGAFDVFVYESPEPVENFNEQGGSGGLFVPCDASGTPQGSPLTIWEIDQGIGNSNYSDYRQYFKVLGHNTPVQVSGRLLAQQTYLGNEPGVWIKVSIDGDDKYHPNPFGTGWEVFTVEYSKTLVLPAGTVFYLDMSYWYQNTGFVIHRGFIGLERYGSVIAIQTSSLPPEPPYLAVDIPVTSSGLYGGTEVSLSIGYAGSLTSDKKGSMQVMLSTRPYRAWNFDIVTKWMFGGQYTMCGSIGLAQDSSNFIAGYIKDGAYGIAKVRGGTLEVITEEENQVIQQGRTVDMRFWHRDGVFGIEVKAPQVKQWPKRGDGLLHSWVGEDGEISTSDDILHVGIFSLIDPPKVRTTGFSYGSSYVGVMPPDADPDDGSSGLAIFPSSGVLEMQGIKFNYSSKSVNLASDKILGPFHVRNTESWESPFNKDPDDSFTYQGGKATEFLDFAWLPGRTGYNLYSLCLVASAGYAWPIQQIQWKVWITTSGKLVWLRNRARVYSSLQPDYYPGGNERAYITNGFSGVSAVEQNEATEYMSIDPGTFAYVDSDDYAILRAFLAFNGDPDYSVKSLLDRVCKMSGTEVAFKGDVVLEDRVIDSTPLELE